jgi:hypothetical protein
MSHYFSWQGEIGLERSCGACDNTRAVAAADVAAEGEAHADAVAGDGQAQDGSGTHEDNGKSAESRPVLNADTAGTFSILQLLDFWGCDAVMGQKSHDGTLEDAAEADLKVGEKVLLIASEELPYSEGMLCYRHLCTVLLVASEDDPVHFDEVKLRFVKWPLPKYDIWIHKRHWHIERVTHERLKEQKEYNKQYERVKKWVAAEESKRRQLKRQRQAPPSNQEDANSSSDSELKSGAKPRGKALQPPKRSHAAERLLVSQFKFAAKDQKNVCLTSTATQINNECGVLSNIGCPVPIIDANDGHQIYCHYCGEPGNIIMCDAKDCPLSFHFHCVGLSEDMVPKGEWICPEHPEQDQTALVAKSSLAGATIRVVSAKRAAPATCDGRSDESPITIAAAAAAAPSSGFTPCSQPSQLKQQPL